MLFQADCVSTAAWKLHYYQWVMQIFEQYNMSEGACQFAFAALEEVDEALGSVEDRSTAYQLQESSNAVSGRLWANIFKFTLDLNNYYGAFCAIITNPDQESQYICLRRFIIVLYERGEIQVQYNLVVSVLSLIGSWGLEWNLGGQSYVYFPTCILPSIENKPFKLCG